MLAVTIDVTDRWKGPSGGPHARLWLRHRPARPTARRLTFATVTVSRSPPSRFGVRRRRRPRQRRSPRFSQERNQPEMRKLVFCRPAPRCDWCSCSATTRAQFGGWKSSRRGWLGIVMCSELAQAGWWTCWVASRAISGYRARQAARCQAASQDAPRA